MHLLTLIALVAVVVFALASALVKTCVDLLERGPYEAPLLSDDGLRWRTRIEPRPIEVGREGPAYLAPPT